MTLEEIVLKEGARVGGNYEPMGRYPYDSPWWWESGIPRTPEEFAEAMASDDPERRVAALTYARNLQVTLPALWVVVEAADSPNLLYAFGRDHEPKSQDERVRRHTWSSHVDRVDAEAWRDMFQQKSDALVERNRWGARSRRIFEVVWGEGASAHSLRQPGAEPRTAGFQ